MIIGIDIGGTTTDIVGLRAGEILHPLSVKADDPVTSAAGALGKFVEETGRSLNEIKLIAATGVGASRIKNTLLGIPVKKINEFMSIGTAGAHLTGLSKAIVVSMGTGTAIVKVNAGEIKHWGGTGVGGGTMVGLSDKLLNITSIHTLMDKAAKGQLNMVDLTVGDIAGGELVGLPETATASNFGKLSDEATDHDVAMAIINLVGQTIAIMGMSAARSEQINDLVLTGKLSILPLMRKVVDGVGHLYNTHIVVPEYSEFATAIGAAIFADR